MVQSGTLSSPPHMIVVIPAPAPHGCSRQVSEDSPWYIPAAGGRVARCGAPCAAQAAPRQPLTESWLVTAGAQSLVRSPARGSHQPRPRHMSPVPGLVPGKVRPQNLRVVEKYCRQCWDSDWLETGRCPVSTLPSTHWSSAVIGDHTPHSGTRSLAQMVIRWARQFYTACPMAYILQSLQYEIDFWGN